MSKQIDTQKPEESASQVERVVRYDDWNNVSFMTNNGEIRVKILDGEMRIFCDDGKLKITPWATNNIRLSIE